VQERAGACQFAGNVPDRLVRRFHPRAVAEDHESGRGAQAAPWI